MRRRVLMIASGAVVGLVLVVVLGFMVLLATRPGHNALRKYGVRLLNESIDGTARIGRVSGTLWRGAEVEQVELLDTAGNAIIRVGRVKVGYGLRDLIRGRIILRNIELVRPTIVLEQLPDGAWNVQHLFRLRDTTESAPKPRMLVDLRGVTVTDGTIIVRRRPAPDSVITTRLLGVAMDLRRLRLSHPDSSAMLADVAALAARLDEPAVAVSRMAGTVELDGDSTRFDLDELGVGTGTRLALTGRVRWDGEHPAGVVEVRARSVRFADLRGVAPGLPRDGGGSVEGRVTLLAGGGAAIDVTSATVSDDRSRVRGSAALTLGARGHVTLSRANLTLAPLDLRSLEPWADTLPVRGTVHGRLEARGAGNQLRLAVDATFRDAAAPGSPSRVLVSGPVRLGGAAGIEALGVVIQRVEVPLATLQRFTSVAPGPGRVTVSGTLFGPWRDLRLEGATLALTDGITPPTVLRGAAAARFNSPAYLNVQLAIDTIAFAQLARFVPGVPLKGRGSGQLGLSGYVDSLDFNVYLHGEWGAAQARGTFERRDSVSFIDVAGTMDSLDLSRHVATLPPTRLAGRWALQLRLPRGDTAAGPTGTGHLALDTIRIAEVPFQAGGARVTLEPDRYAVDSLWLEREDFHALLTGAIGKEGAGPRQITFTVRADTVERLAPIVRWVRRQADSTVPDTVSVPQGGFRVSGRIIGTTAQVDLDASVESSQLRLDSAGVRGLNLIVVASPLAAVPRFDVLLRADSVWAGGLAYGRIRAAAAGTADTFAARAALRLGEDAEALAAVRVARDGPVTTARVDTMSLALPSRRWSLVRPFAVTLDPDSITIDTVDVRAETGGGRLLAAGTLPRAQPGDFSLSADSLLLPAIYALAGRDTVGIGGYLGLNLRITGPAAAPTMNVIAVLEDGRFDDYRMPLLQLVGRYEERRLTFKGGLWRDTVRVLNIGASLPVDLSLTSVPNRRLPGDYSITARADSVELAVLNQLTSVVEDPSGLLVANVEIRGAWGEPARVNGTVEVARGALTIPVIGARYSDIHARFALSDTVITIERARLTSGGTLDLGGRVVLRRGQDVLPLLQLTMRAERFEAMNMREFAGVTATGDLRLAGPTLGATLTGRATIDEGYLMFADLVEKRIVNLDDPEFRAIVDSTLAVSRELAPGAFTVFMDSLRIANLQVGMGSQVWLRSTEANIQLSGDFRVSKTVEDGIPRYRLDGTLEANRGTYRLSLGGVATKDFRVTRGTVRFFGAPDFNPEMDIAAEHTLRTAEGSNLVVRAIIQGTIQAPVLRLETDQQPPLSETEIVSYLMFGRPTFELYGGEGAQNEVGLVANVTSTLLGTAANTLQQSLVSELGLPIDYLTVRPGSSTFNQDILGSATVEAGKQLSSRTFLTLNAGLCEVRHGQSLTSLLGASIEYRLSRHWMIEASYEPIVSDCRNQRAQRPGTNYQVGFDLFWQSGIR